MHQFGVECSDVGLNSCKYHEIHWLEYEYALHSVPMCSHVFPLFSFNEINRTWKSNSPDHQFSKLPSSCSAAKWRTQTHRKAGARTSTSCLCIGLCWMNAELHSRGQLATVRGRVCGCWAAKAMIKTPGPSMLRMHPWLREVFISVYMDTAHPELQKLLGATHFLRSSNGHEQWMLRRGRLSSQLGVLVSHESCFHLEIVLATWQKVALMDPYGSHVLLVNVNRVQNLNGAWCDATNMRLPTWFSKYNQT